MPDSDKEYEAGRELDALIAEKVMGLSGVGYYGPTKSHGQHTDNRRYSTPKEALEAYKIFWPHPPERGYASWKDIEPVNLCSWKENWGPVFVHEFSTDIAAAWEVVDKLHADGECLTLSYAIHDSTDQKKWMAEFRHANSWVTADTAPLAICRAALKAVKP